MTTWKILPDIITSITGKTSYLTPPRITLENAADRAYVDSQIATVSATGIPKLNSYPYSLAATTAAQRQFTIPMDTFDSTTDTLMVWIGSVYTPPSDYVVTNTVRDTGGVVTARGYFTLNNVNGVDANTTVDIVILKNVPIGTDGSINGSVIAVNSLPSNRVVGLDTRLGSIEQIVPATSVNLTNGLQVVTTTRAGLLQNFKAQGRTLVNLLGRDGNCEDTSKWTTDQATIALDTASKYGTNAIKITGSSSIQWGGTYHQIYATKANSYYVALVDALLVSGGDSVYLNAKRDGVRGTVLTGGISSSFTSNTGFTTLYQKFQAPSDNPALFVSVEVKNVSAIAKMDGVRIIEISQADYNAIDTMTAAQVAAKYPYVDDVKHLSGLYVWRYGENLLSQFNEWTMTDSTDVAIEPYKLVITPTATWRTVTCFVNVAPSTTYTFNFTGNAQFAIGDEVSNITYVNFGVYANSVTFTTNATSKQVEVSFSNGAATSGTFTATNPRLNIGAVDKGFKPRNDDMMIFPVALASSMDGTVYDQIYNRDGRFWRENVFKKDMVLDGSLSWAFASDYTGYKSVSINSLANPTNSSNAKLVKYDGKVSKQLFGAGTAADQFDHDNGTYLWITIADTDSGWGEAYTPTVGEIQAYFWGWKMYDSSASCTDTSTYTRTDGLNKAWGFKNKDGVWVNGTGTLPTTNAGAGSGQFALWQRYKLTYQLAIPTFDDLTETMEGQINLLEGTNQIEIGAGMQLREKAYPQANGTTMVINHSSAPSSNLSRRTAKIVDVYRNGRVDKYWDNVTTADGFSNGLARARILNGIGYDSTATYEVTYQALDQYLLTTSPVTTITGEYDANIKTIQDRLSQKVSDNEQRLSVAELLAARTYNKPDMSLQDTVFYIDGTNGSDSGDGSASKPFKTIGKACSTIPQVVNHAYTINVSMGTYNEDVVLRGFVGMGSLSIYGDTAISTNYTVNRFAVNHCTIPVTIRGFNLVTTTNPALANWRSPYVWFQYMNAVASVSINTAGAYCSGGNLLVWNSVVSNKTGGQGMLVDNGGIIFAKDTTGSNSSVNYYAYLGGKISLSGTQLSGAINNQIFVAEGSSIQNSTGSGVVSGPGLVNPWGDNTFSNRSSALMTTTIALTVTNSGTWYKVPFNNKVFDNLTEYDGVTNYRFTAKHSGLYHIDLQFGIQTCGTANTRVLLGIFRNGTFASYLGDIMHPSTGYFSVRGALNFNLAAGDFLEFYVQGQNFGNVVMDTNNQMTILAIAQIA